MLVFTLNECLIHYIGQAMVLAENEENEMDETTFKIVEENFASILNNDPECERVQLSLATHLNSDGFKRYFIVTDSNEHTGPEEKTRVQAKANVEAMWGGQHSPWDLQYN